MFTIALSNVLLTLCYMVPAYLLCKCKKATADHLSTLSTLLVYVGSPCLAISSFLSLTYSRELLIEMVLFFVATLVLQVLFVLLMFLLLRRKYDDVKYRILNVACVMGNVGFFGQPMIRALLPDNPEAMCYTAIFSVTMNIISFTMAIFCLTRDRKYMTPRAALLNPAMIALIISLPLFLTNANRYIPTMVLDALLLIGKLTTPLCMLIMGIRLATVPFKNLFADKFVYLVCFGKQILFPLFCFAAVSFLPVSVPFRVAILILCATPCASMLLNMAELHHTETKFCANCVLVSTLTCAITLPVLSLLL